MPVSKEQYVAECMKMEPQELEALVKMWVGSDTTDMDMQQMSEALWEHIQKMRTAGCTEGLI